MNIYIVRHTAVNVKDRCYGQFDVPLKDSFSQEAVIVKNNLPRVEFDKVYSSPLSRCRKLANYCGYKETAELDDRLMELNFGEWEMKSWGEIKGFDQWLDDKINHIPPNGESVSQMMERIAGFYDSLRGKNYRNVLVFAHGGVINCSRHYFGLIELENIFEVLAEYGEMVNFKM